MFIIMTIDTQQFPIATVRRIVIMIMIAMMYRQLPEIFPGKLPRTTAANPWIELQCLFPITLLPLFPVATCLGDDPVQFLF